MKTDIPGAQMCASFALKPSSLRYCGNEKSPKAAYDCIKYGKCDAFRETIPSYKALNSYLKVISDKLGKDIFDLEVVDGYWIGNPSIEKFQNSDFSKLLKELKKQTVPREFLRELRIRFKNEGVQFFPHHTFNVLFVGVGNVTGSVEFNLKNINNCMIRPIEIVTGSGRRFSAATKDIMAKVPRFGGKRFNYIEEKFEVDLKIHPEVINSKYAAVHWGEVCFALSDEQKGRLEYYNEKVIKEEIQNSKIKNQNKFQ